MDIPSQPVLMNVFFVKIQTLGLEIIASRFGVEWVVNWTFPSHQPNKEMYFRDCRFSEKINKKRLQNYDHKNTRSFRKIKKNIMREDCKIQICKLSKTSSFVNHCGHLQKIYWVVIFFFLGEFEKLELNHSLKNEHNFSHSSISPIQLGSQILHENFMKISWKRYISCSGGRWGKWGGGLVDQKQDQEVWQSS